MQIKGQPAGADQNDLMRAFSHALEQLARKVQQAADEIASLRKENLRLQSELETHKDDGQRARELARENDNFQREQNRLRVKLERLKTKIDKLLKIEPPMTFASSGKESTHEEHD